MIVGRYICPLVAVLIKSNDTKLLIELAALIAPATEGEGIHSRSQTLKCTCSCRRCCRRSCRRRRRCHRRCRRRCRRSCSWLT